MDCSGLISKPLVNKECLYSPFSSRRDHIQKTGQCLRASQRARVSKPQPFIRTHSAKSPVQKKLPWFSRTGELGEHAARMYLAVFVFSIWLFSESRWPTTGDTHTRMAHSETRTLYMQIELSETSEFTKCWIPADFVTQVPVFPSLIFFFLTNFALKWTS